jgi:hypothetical protein
MSIEIKNVYLMWVGSEHYPDIAAYVAEAEKLGVSKRLPNGNVAGKMMEPGTVIFIAHDEGNAEACPKCPGLMENPELRKAENRVAIQERRLEQLKADLKKVQAEKKKARAQASAEPKPRVPVPSLVEDEDIKRAKGFVERAEAKLAKLKAEVAATPTAVTDSTGGYVDIDGQTWDYRRYNYWLHQPAKWDPASHKVENSKMCDHCGGTGRLPLGKVFGMFLPSAIEYIMRPEDTETMKKEMEAKGYRVIAPGKVATEIKRGCGRRKAGGYYAVTDAESKRAIEATVKELREKGAIPDGEVELNGDFVRFVTPVDIPGTKRFRGIKSWSLSVAVEEEAEMIMEAV